MVAGACSPTVCRGNPRGWEASRVVRGSRQWRVVDAETLADVERGIDARTSILHSALRTPHYVYRAPLPLRLLVSRRRFAPRAARAHGHAAWASGARPHRSKWPVRLDGVRAGSEVARPSADPGRGADAARRVSRNAAYRDTRGVCEPVPAHHRGASRPDGPARPAARLRDAGITARGADRALGLPLGSPADGTAARRESRRPPARRALPRDVRARELLRRAAAQSRAGRSGAHRRAP